MVKNAGSKNKRGRLMKNMKSPNSGLTDVHFQLNVKTLLTIDHLSGLAHYRSDDLHTNYI